MPVEQEVLDYQYDDSHVTVQPCKNNTLLATNLTWQSDRQYYEGDVVYRNGRMYVAKNNNIDKRPDITTNWTLTFAEPFRPSGMVPSNNVSDANNDIDISAGRCYDSTGLIPISGTAMTKRLDASIALGSGTGGLFSGSKANSTLYYIFAIVRDNDGTVNYGFSTSLTATDRPTGWTTYACIGSFFTNGSGNIIGGKYTRFGSKLYFTYNTFLEDRAYATLATSARVLITSSAPPNCLVHTSISGYGPATTTYVYFGETNQTDTAASSSYYQYILDSAGKRINTTIDFLLDASKQFFVRSSDSDFYLKVNCLGYTQFL